jgi:FkbM family methyltransferase
MIFNAFGAHLNKSRRYLPLAYSRSDWFSFAVLGSAPRGRFSFVTRQLFPELVVRPSLLGGLKVALNPADPSHIAVFNEFFFENNYDLGLIPFTPDQIFDCGGHIGLFSLLVHSRYPKAHQIIFEPNMDNMEWIRRQARLNALNIEVVQAAVSIREGEALFEDRVSYSGHLVDEPTTSIPKHQGWISEMLGEPRGRYAVRVIDLAAILAQRRPERLLLKLDVEGEEIRIIPTLFDVLPRQAAVLFETHHGQADWDWASRQFTEHGFVVERQRSIGDYFINGFALRQ